MKRLKKLEGIFPVLATPMTVDEEVDEQGMRRLIRYVLKAESSGVVVCGSMGELPALTTENRRRAIEIVKDEVKDERLVIAGTGDCSLRKTLNSTKIAQEAGADFALVVPPYYFPLAQREIVAYYRELAREATIPILIYNIPECTKIPASLEAIRQLGNEERIAGIKDSSGDFIFFEKLVQQTKHLENFAVLMGIDNLLLAGFAIGADGAVVWASNIVPELPLELYKAVKDNDFEKARDIQETLISIGEAIGRRELHSGVKAALSLLGICERTVSKPLPALSQEEVRELAENLKKLKIL